VGDGWPDLTASRPFRGLPHPGQTPENDGDGGTIPVPVFQESDMAQPAPIEQSALLVIDIQDSRRRRLKGPKGLKGHKGQEIFVFLVLYVP
jgi:hypothetical protein